MGFTALPGLAQECKPDHIGSITHPSDITVLVICTIMSFCVLFLYAAQITGKLSNSELADEYSLTYAFFASCLKREKERYEKEKFARYALMKRDSDEEIAGPFDYEDKYSGDEEESMLLRGSGSASRRTQSTLPSSEVGGGNLEAERLAEVDAVLLAQR